MLQVLTNHGEDLAFPSAIARADLPVEMLPERV